MEVLQNLPLFQGLDADAERRLSEKLERKHLENGSLLFRQGDPGDALYLVLSGGLAVLLRQPDGQETFIKELGPGECVGEMALLSGQPRTATIVARGDTELVRLSKADFEQLSETHPELIRTLAQQVLPRFRGLQANLVLSDLFGKLDEAALAELDGNLLWKGLTSGEVLFRQGEPGDCLYIVVQGRLRFSAEGPDGSERILGEVGAGECIGEFALLAEAGSPESLRSATVYATRRTDVVGLTRPVFERIVCRSPQILLSLTRRMIRRQRQVTNPANAVPAGLVLSVVPARPGLDLTDFAGRLSEALKDLGSTQVFNEMSFERLYGKPGASSTPIGHPLSLMINVWLNERQSENRHIVYHSISALDGAGRLTPWTQRCLEHADVILLVGNAGEDVVPGAVEAALTAARTKARLELVLVHPEGTEYPRHTRKWLEPRRSGVFPVQAHHHVRPDRPSDFRRLARRITGRPVGLVLAGGGARGWAHAGAIQALEEAGIEIDWVAGASMGAIVAAGYALDWTVEKMERIAAEFSNPKKLLDYTFPYVALTSTRRITNLISDFFSDLGIEDTWRAYFCISANLTRAEEEVHETGPLWRAVRASMAFPALFTPILGDGCILIDGGAANNLPVDHMRRQCADGFVIGVDLITGSPLGRGYDFGPSLSGWQILKDRLNPFAKTGKIPTLLDIVAGIVDSNSRRRLKEVRHMADLMIEIPMEAYSLLEFSKHAEIIKAGYLAAKEQIRDCKLPIPGR